MSNTYSLDEPDNKEEKDRPGNNTDAIISLRLPSSLLEKVEESSEIILCRSKGNGYTDGMIRNEVDGSEEPLSLQNEPVAASDIYRSKDACRTSLARAGTTKKKRYIGRQQSIVEVRNLGQKARRRLIEENSKRREIVHLEEDPAPRRAPGGVLNANSKRETHTVAHMAKKRRIHITKARASHQRIDKFTPNLDNLLSLPHEERSNVVRLHGLPLGICPEEIVKFFAGLDPERIFVLPNYSHMIRKWDVPLERDGNTRIVHVDRHENVFRVYVKFSSAPVADMASTRNGEIIYLKSNAIADGAAIAVCGVQKSAATFLVRHMAIDCIAGVPICQSLASTEERLSEGVTKILWSMAKRTLNLDSAKDRGDNDSILWDKDVEDCDPSNLAGYQQLAKYHNKLVEVYQGLENEATCLATKSYDPSLLSDPIVKLTSSASSFLEEEIDSIRHKLSTT